MEILINYTKNDMINYKKIIIIHKNKPFVECEKIRLKIAMSKEKDYAEI